MQNEALFSAMLGHDAQHTNPTAVVRVVRAGSFSSIATSSVGYDSFHRLLYAFFMALPSGKPECKKGQIFCSMG